MADDNSQKITHDYCQYRQGNPQQSCAGCHHYTGNGCGIVQDPIDPNGVCNFFCQAQPNQRGGLLGQLR